MQEKQSNKQVLIFVVSICVVCALVLAILASLLAAPQAKAKELYRVRQLLISSRILSHKGEFLLPDQDGNYSPAVFDATTKTLQPSDEIQNATEKQIFEIYNIRIYPRLVDVQGNLYTFEQLDIDQTKYLHENEKYGYAQLTYKLIYLVMPNLTESELKNTPDLPAYAYVIPVNGYGLWDAIYGYIALESNADTVIGTTWYDEKETPGLGGEISLESWQKQFYKKVIFQTNPDGTKNLKRAPLGITIVRTNVLDELGDSPEAKSAVDGIAGASTTGTGVSEAYRNSLNPYREFLIKAHNLVEQK